ncbi:Lsr2 family protein [Amycolatopsis sp. NPDC001319]|uniref:histone-like nucleoid-structuring protein Lsr2 n=1 Tax=unclassified Amycolatopsis TaxID=2618356 RepID=UPI0036D01CF1
MAKKVTIEISDDTDGSPADQTIPFGLDGVTYEIDLSASNAEALRSALQPYMTVARRTGGRRVKLAVGQSTDGTSKQPQTVTDHPTTHAIRSWAQNNGYEVAAHGRIARSVLDAHHSSRQARSSRTSPKTRTRPGKTHRAKRSSR